MLIEYQKTGVMPNCVNMGSGLKTNVLTMKYTNTTGFHDELNSLFLKLKIKSLESKTEVFEGGNTGLCVMKMEDTGLKKEVDDGLKAIKDLVNYKWD